MTSTITIQMDKKCSACGKGGAIEQNPSGLCMKCISKIIREKLRAQRKATAA